MKKMRQTGLLLLLVGLIVVTACSKGNSGSQPSSSVTGTPEPSTASQASPSASAADPLGKYDPPIELSVARDIGTDFNFDQGEDINKNAIYQAYENDLGIKLKNIWSVPDTQYAEKIKLAIASNSIPDLFKVPNLQEVQNLIDSDMIMDLTDVFNQYASDDTKAWYQKDGGTQLDSAKFDGKLMAIPSTDSPYGAAQMIWLRKDWLQNVGLQAPKTMQDLLKIAEAFTKQDPDKNGKPDTMGVALTNALTDNRAHGITGFFNGYHSYPGAWVKDSSGKLVYGSVQPETKQALQALQDMYKAGEIPKEFATQDVNKINELVANGKLGISFGAFWQGAWPLQGAIVKDGKLAQNWEVYPIVSVDDQPAKTQTDLGLNGYYVVSKKAEHPEAAIKILNQWIASTMGKADKVYRFGASRDENNAVKQLWKLNPISMFEQDNTITAANGVSKALESNDTSALTNQDMKDRYNGVKKYEAGDANQWGLWIISKKGGAFPIMAKYLENDQYQPDQFYGAPTPGMIDKMPILKQKEIEVFTKIIMGQSIDTFDQFVSEWKTLGGDQITQEVNDWAAKRSK